MKSELSKIKLHQDEIYEECKDLIENFNMKYVVSKKIERYGTKLHLFTGKIYSLVIFETNMNYYIYDYKLTKYKFKESSK